MDFPAFMPPELSFVRGVDSQESLFKRLVQKPVDLVTFLEAASDDETWCERHDLFLRLAMDWLTQQAYMDKLEHSYLVRIAKIVWKHIRIFKPFIIDNLTMRFEGGEISVNGLLLAASSEYFKKLLINECRDKETTTFTIRHVGRNVVMPMLSFVSNGAVAELATMSSKELEGLIKQAESWGLDGLSHSAQRMLGKYLTDDNFVLNVALSRQERWVEFAERCAEYVQRRDWGFSLKVISVDRLAFEFHRFHEETIAFYHRLKPWITDLACHGDLAGDHHFGEVLKASSTLRGLDVSGTFDFYPSFMELPKGLESLEVSECPWTGRETLKRLLLACPALRMLNMSSNAHLTASAWGELVKFKSLVGLDLSQCHQIQDADLSIIAKGGASFTSLSLSNCSKISERGFLDLAKMMPRLARLSLQRCAITDNALVELSDRCRDLAVLDLAGCEAVTEKGIIAAVRLAHALQKLDITRCRVTHTAIDEMRRLSPRLHIVW